MQIGKTMSLNSKNKNVIIDNITKGIKDKDILKLYATPDNK